MLACYLVMFLTILHVTIYCTSHMIIMETISNHLVRSRHTLYFIYIIVYVLLLVFIYTCPGYSCSVKERMLYSSCKGPVTDVCEQQFGITIAKKVLVMLAKQLLIYSINKPTSVSIVCGILFQQLLLVLLTRSF